MKSKNICKFVPPDITSQLIPIRFILETEPDAMRNATPKPVHRMVLITNHSGKLILNNHTFRCSAGDIIMLFEGETYFFESEAGFQYMYIDFKGLRSNELFRRFGINEFNRIFSGLDGLIPLWMESLSRASKENIDLVSESILLYTFSRLNYEHEKYDSCVNKIIEITEEDFSNPQLSISFIAEELGYNSKYLSHIFKKKTGIGYTEYLQNFRIKYAISLFENGIDSIKNVALLSGYTDSLYFSTVFKNKTGTSPKNYIKNHFEKQTK
jgi:AraC-like DNA-binding protein